MPSMTQDDLRDSRYRQHMQALQEHEALIGRLNQSEAEVCVDQIRFSLEKLAITLEEYFKVIGIL